MNSNSGSYTLQLVVNGVLPVVTFKTSTQYQRSGSTPVISREKEGIQVRRMDVCLGHTLRWPTAAKRPLERKGCALRQNGTDTQENYYSERNDTDLRGFMGCQLSLPKMHGNH